MADAAGRMKRNVLLILAAGVVCGVLMLPNHPDGFTWRALTFWPIELLVVIFAMLTFGRLRGVASAIAALLVAVSLLKIADLVSFVAYDRHFNPVSDLFLVEAGVGLLVDSLGAAGAAAIFVGFILAIVLLFVILRSGLKAWGRTPLRGWARGGAVAGLLMASGWAAVDTGHHMRAWRFESSPPGSAHTTRVALERIWQAHETAADLARFRALAETDPMQGVVGALDLLDGRDVLLIWIESYGRASFDNPLYADTHGDTLRKAEEEIRQTGLAMRSGWLTSPTAGGQSWLAHGAFASALWTSDNGRYRAMLASGQKWIFHLAREAGYRTSAFMPAITLPWPESAVMGFDHVFEAKDIPYQGAPFNWVTMPDQYTLSVYQDLLPEDTRPDFIQIALISSHAPWTPVPDMVPWNEIGDGRVFDDMAARGPTPRELWKDRDDVRDAYRRAIDYSLQAVFSHVSRLAEDAPLIVIAGDHQPAGFVAGSDDREVPLHIIGPAEVLSRIDGWGWSEGLFPAADGPVQRMDRFRGDFIAAFTSRNQIADAKP